MNADHDAAQDRKDALASHWIFLRGLIRETAHWDDFPERFAQGIPGAQVTAIDLPGCGRHWRESSPMTLQAITERIRECASAELATDESGKIYLLSLSLGGMIAVDWAHRHPHELAGAVLINTSLRGLNPFFRRLSPGAWPLLAGIATARSLAARERGILQLTAARPESREFLIPQRVDIQRRRPVSGRNALRQLWAAARYRPPPHSPEIPLLLLNSLGDRMVHPGCTEAIARAWQLAHGTHPWAGHDLPLDDPRWVIQAVAAWLGKR